MLRPTNRAMVSSGPSNQFRYACVPLSLVSVMGGRSSTMTTLGTRCRTARWYAAAAPAIPAPQITISAVSIALLGAIREHPGPDHDDAALAVAPVELDRNQATRVRLDRLDQLRTHVHFGGAGVVDRQPIDEKSSRTSLDAGRADCLPAGARCSSGAVRTCATPRHRLHRDGRRSSQL